MLSAAVSAFYGFTSGFILWEGNQTLRHLVIRREEQCLFYSCSVCILLIYFNTSVLQNASLFCGGRVGWALSKGVSCSHYLISFVVFVFMRSRKSFDVDKENISWLQKEFRTVDFSKPPANEIFSESLKLDEQKRSEFFRRLLLQFFRNGGGDYYLCVQGINRAHARVNSCLTRAFYSAGDFLVMHIGDIVIVITSVYLGAAIYLGKNLIENTILALFCLLCLGEHKPFWMKPSYNDGPLCTFSNRIRMFLFRPIKFASGISVVYDYFLYFVQYGISYFSYYTYCGVFGKLWACVSLAVNLFTSIRPEAVSSCLDYLIECVRRGVRDQLLAVGDGVYGPHNRERNFLNEMIDSFLGNEELCMADERNLYVSKKLFTAFSCRDPCPDIDVRALEKELVKCVNECRSKIPDLDTFMVESCQAGGPSNYSVFVELTGKDSTQGMFSKHVNMCIGGRESLERDSKMILHICIFNLQRGNISPLKELIAHSSSVRACPGLVARDMNDLCLRLFTPFLIGQQDTFGGGSHLFEGVNIYPLGGHDKCNFVLIKFQLKVLQICQQLRNRLCKNLFTEMTLHRDSLLQEASHISLNVVRGFVQFFLENIYREVVDEIGTNVHFVDIMTSILSEEIGLVAYSEKVYMGIPPLERLIICKVINIFLGGIVKYWYSRNIVSELVDAIIEDGDLRIGICDLYEAVRELMDSEEEKKLLLDEHNIVADCKPTFDRKGNWQAGENFEGIIDFEQNFSHCVALRKKHVRPRLIWALLKLGMLEERKVKEGEEEAEVH